jgi:hypothetical protein
VVMGLSKKSNSLICMGLIVCKFSELGMVEGYRDFGVVYVEGMCWATLTAGFGFVVGFGKIRMSFEW